MLTDEEFNFIAEGCEDMELNAIWDYFDKPFGTRFLPHAFESFESRREAFLWVMKRLLEEGRIKLGENLQTNIQVVHGTIDEQVEQFRQAFPKNDEEMDKGYWFFDEKCPAGVMWQHFPDERR